MNYRIILFISCLFCLSSCSFQSTKGVQYIGEIHNTSQEVTIYYSEDDIPYNYKTIGQAISVNSDVQESKLELVEKAKLVGADAIIVKGFSSDTYGVDGSTRCRLDVHASFLKAN